MRWLQFHPPPPHTHTYTHAVDTHCTLDNPDSSEGRVPFRALWDKSNTLTGRGPRIHTHTHTYTHTARRATGTRVGEGRAWGQPHPPQLADCGRDGARNLVVAQYQHAAHTRTRAHTHVKRVGTQAHEGGLYVSQIMSPTHDGSVPVNALPDRSSSL